MSTSPTLPPNVLAAVDETPSARAVVVAAARRAAADGDARLVLFHLLPTIPTGYLEFGGRDTPEEERRGLERQRRRRREWVEREAEARAQPLFDRLSPFAREVGLPDARIGTCYDAPDPESTPAREILRVAKERRCGAIYVGREAYPPHRELFHTHVGDELRDRAEDEPIEIHEIDENGS